MEYFVKKRLSQLRPSLLCTALAFLLLAAVPSTAFADKGPSKGYKISLHIKGNTDTVMYLGNYYAGKTYVIDTAQRDRKGNFLFEHKERTLNPGMYFFVNDGGDYVEFVIHNEAPTFSFETNEDNWADHMRVKGSKENELFYRYSLDSKRLGSQIDSVYRIHGNDTVFEAFRHQKTVQLDSIRELYINEMPNSMLALMMNATREPGVPTTDSLGNALSDMQRWEYFMEHYFDFTRLSDDALIRTPDRIFHKRLTDYLDHYLKNAPAELICKYVDLLVDKARPSKENFKYLIYTISEKYLQSNVMSYDAIYVHMVKKYIETGEASWMSATTIDENVKRANTWDKLLIGRVAPELIMKDVDGHFHSLHHMPGKYKLLVFWSPTCGHCKTMIPDLHKSWSKLKDEHNISAFAVFSEPDEYTRPKWLEFIKQHNLDWVNIDGAEANIDWHEVYDVITTPQIYLLDQDNKIIAKRINAESFENIIRMLDNEKQQ